MTAGHVDTKGRYEKGHQSGEWSYYFETGALSKTQNFKEGKLSGKSVSYYPNTKVQSVCQYTLINDRRKGKIQSVPDGEWIFYDKNGTEVSRITYDKGERK